MRSDKIDCMRYYETSANKAFEDTEAENPASLQKKLQNESSIALHRELMKQKLTEKYGTDVAQQYIRDLESHILYKHDEASLLPHSCSLSLHPLLKDGFKGVGGSSKAPKHADTYCESFVTLLFHVSSQIAAAIKTPGFLMCLDHFLRLDYGKDYFTKLDKIVEHKASGDLTLRQKVENLFQKVVYSLNQPLPSKENKPVFWEVSYYDKFYFETLFKNFSFPDRDRPSHEGHDALQKMFIRWLNRERSHEVLPFPIETFHLLTDGKDNVKDLDNADFCAEVLSEGHSFFIHQSDHVEGAKASSKGIMTLNINRIVQDWKNQGSKEPLKERIREITQRVHKYLSCFNDILSDSFHSGMLQIYTQGFDCFDKQFLTVGINGFIEGAQFLNYEVDPNSTDFKKYVSDILLTIKEMNRKDSDRNCRFDSAFVKDEALGLNNALWDRKEGYWVPREIYNPNFYGADSDGSSSIKNFELAGCLDGICSMHLSLCDNLPKDEYMKLMRLAIRFSCSDFTFNVPNTLCNDCSYIVKRELHNCPRCGSTNVDYLTREIVFLKRISKVFLDRQEEIRRHYYLNIHEASESRS